VLFTPNELGIICALNVAIGIVMIVLTKLMASQFVKGANMDNNKTQ
jgi:hypothetical protein